MLAAFDRWADRGPFTPVDLAVFRIVFAVGALLLVPRIEFAAQLPQSFLDPPPGPMMLLTAIPPLWVLIAVEVVVVVSLSSLAVGFLTRWSSVLSAVSLLAAFGLRYSFGRIDHTILMVVVPLVLAGSGWGSALSVDSRIRPRPPFALQWTLRLLALLIGLAFLWSGIEKLRGGWLRPSSQAVRAQLLQRYLGEPPGGPFTVFYEAIDSVWMWEAMDWLSVALELGVVLTVLHWTAFRAMLAVLTLFHLGIWLALGIPFPWAVLAYGAFVSWGVVARPLLRRARWPDGRAGIAAAAAVAVVLAAGAFALVRLAPGAITVAGSTIVVIGAVAGAASLLLLARRVVRVLVRPASPAR